jgi:hypothetical protein
MTPEEVEELLRRVPELQPPPGLEDRLPRAAAPKRFPAATAIAASIMFCLGILYLVIDSAQDPAPPSLGIKDEALRIVIEHQGDCDEARCTDLRHWKQKPADLAGWRTDRRVVILAKSSAPWGAVRRALDGCVQAGLVRIDYSSPGGDRPLPVTPPPAPRGPEKVILEQIRIILSRKPGREETVRKVGNRAESPTIEDLMHIVLTMVADYGKAGKAEAPIHIDPGADVPWEDVLQIVEICRKERLGPVEFVPPVRGKAAVAELLPAGAGPRTPAQPDETSFADLQKELGAGRLGDAVKVLSDMIARYPDSSYTVRGYTRVRARLDGADDLVAADYRKKWLTLAPVVYDALIKPRKFVDGRGVLDPTALGKTAPEIAESLNLYMELGYMQRELARSGQKFQYDNASTVFSNVLRVVMVQCEWWWICKYEVLATLVDRGAGVDLKLAKVGLENVERAYPEFDEAKYGQKERFLRLKEKIAELLQPK